MSKDWNGQEYPAQYVCRRCGKKIPKGDNGLASRRLAVYCETCAAIVAERVSSRKPPAVRVVRFRTGRNDWREYRGTFPAAAIRGRDIIFDKRRTI